jgi:hypothetical protein
VRRTGRIVHFRRTARTDPSQWGSALILNDADGQGGGNASDHEARETVADAEAIFSKLKKWVKSNYNSKGKSLGAARRAKISTLKPANNSTRKTRRSCRTLFPMTSVIGI